MRQGGEALDTKAVSHGHLAGGLDTPGFEAEQTRVGLPVGTPQPSLLEEINGVIESLKELKGICDKKNQTGYQIGPSWDRAISTIAYDALARWHAVLVNRLDQGAMNDSLPDGLDLLSQAALIRDSLIHDELAWVDRRAKEVEGLQGCYELIVDLSSRLLEVGREDPEAHAVAVALKNALVKFRLVSIDQVKTELTYPQETPLSLVSRNRIVLEFLKELDYFRRQVTVGLESGKFYTLDVALDTLAEVRNQYTAEVLSYQGALRNLCDLLCNRFVGNTEVWSHVMVVVDGERKLKSRIIDHAELRTRTDGQLREDLMREFEAETSRPTLSANFVEYRAATNGDLNGTDKQMGVQSLFARIKAGSLTDKIALAMFRADDEFNSDKETNCLTNSLKDVYGLKFVVSSKSQLKRILGQLNSSSGVKFTKAELASVGMVPENGNDRFKVIEFKDYLLPREALSTEQPHIDRHKKKSGFEAAKLVVIWQGRTVEIQIMTRKAFDEERKSKGESAQSHESYRESRERLCQSVADRHPLFGFTRELLRLTFLGGYPEEFAMLSPPPGIVLRLA